MIGNEFINLTRKSYLYELNLFVHEEKETLDHYSHVVLNTFQQLSKMDSYPLQPTVSPLQPAILFFLIGGIILWNLFYLFCNPYLLSAEIDQTIIAYLRGEPTMPILDN
jgi:hypothetical protein